MQSIKDVAPGFSITDVSNEGVIEAIEKGNIVEYNGILKH